MSHVDAKLTFVRTAVSVGALAACVAVPGQARAQEVDDFGSYRARERGRAVESPQHVAFEFRLGRYIPSIDSEFDQATPYETTFGNSTRFSVGAEIDWQALRIPYLGTLGPGLGLAYTKSSAKSFITATGERSGEDTGLTIFPLYLVAVLRADVIARDTPIPLVPYAKFGVGVAPWRVTNGGGTARVGDVAGSGISIGPQFAIGGMLLLDVFDRQSAMSLDNEIGINNSYFFMEWYVSRLGIGNQLEVGTNTWQLGLAFEI